ncbi:hypothetical protein [Flavobacterium hydatis]|uniref:Type II secretion system protein GspC N-terminal domain-containing protein n=1 Tax=Flavobacterium hydatis TaxID=991 RepID=A0A086A5N2_FLAHY|nr:hypothetical protein [Flavobacterium hydatis]KFF11996.1 hypothetical protein IW20_18715 [Flavobacterium hydatis]OXA94256.1 hypothetical protein B0A62_11405 [Flavobacterium hydatis]
MKNKKNIYILLPVVMLIWGIVIFQFFSFTTPDDFVEDRPTEFIIKPLKIVKKDTFGINVNYRDPFLGKAYAGQSVPKVKSNNSGIKKLPKPEEVIVWPTIKYKGLISDSKEKKKVYILIIGGQNYYMKIGDTANEVFLKSGDRESIYVKYKGNLNLIMIAE